MTKKTSASRETRHGYYHEKHEPVMAWWFGREDGKLWYAHKDTVAAGKKIEMKTAAERQRYYDDLPYGMENNPCLCQQGMHASKSLNDAAKFLRNGFVLWRVKLEGDMDVSRSKIAARYRTHLVSVDIYPILVSVLLELFQENNKVKSIISIGDAERSWPPGWPGRHYFVDGVESFLNKEGKVKKFWSRVEELVWEAFKAKGYEE